METWLLRQIGLAVRGEPDGSDDHVRRGHFREDAHMSTVAVMLLAGISVADRAVLHLAASLREAELTFTAERLERAYDSEVGIVALEILDREAILRVLEDCPEELAQSAGDAAAGASPEAARRALGRIALELDRWRRDNHAARRPTPRG